MDEALKKRIENFLKDVAAASGISIDAFEWSINFELKQGPGLQPAGPTEYHLAVIVGKNRKVIKFTDDDLGLLDNHLKRWFLKEFAGSM